MEDCICWEGHYFDYKTYEKMTSIGTVDNPDLSICLYEAVNILVRIQKGFVFHLLESAIYLF